MEPGTSYMDRKLQQAMLAAFPSPRELEQVVRFELHENLARITLADNLDGRVFALLAWAESQGRLGELVRGALASQPGASLLRAWAVEHGLPLPLARATCPYPGLLAYTAAEADVFFGRDAECRQILDRLGLGRQPLVLVVGPSGCGKSSLVFAGVLPRLAGAVAPTWKWVALRPGGPVPDSLPAPAGGDWLPPAAALAAYLQQPPAADRLLVVVDQLEELFAQYARAEQRRFIAELRLLVESAPCQVLLTMRADFYEPLMTSPLWPLVADARVEPTPLAGANLRQAIQQPALLRGAQVEDTLVGALEAAVGEEEGNLPLLQQTLWRLWQNPQNGTTLTLAAYEALGTRYLQTLPAWAKELLKQPLSGIAAVAALQADETLEQIRRRAQADAVRAPAPPDRPPGPAEEAAGDAAVALVRRIFLRLIQFGEGRKDTRRPQTVAQLSAPSDDVEQFRWILESLVRNRLLVMSQDPPAAPPGRPEAAGRPTSAPVDASAAAGRTVDIAHEALIAGWPTLRRWLDERRGLEQDRRRFEYKAQDWLRLRAAGGGLLDRVELTEAQHWLAHPDTADLGSASPDLLALMTASRQAIRRADRLRAGTLVAAGLLVLLLAGGGLALWVRSLEQQAYLTDQMQIARGPTPAPFITGTVRLADGRQVAVSAFALEPYEVTAGRFAACHEAAGPCPALTDVNPAFRNPTTDTLALPITQIDAAQAEQFCTFIGRRLPTLEQWLYAATDSGRSPWPWGTGMPPDHFANLQTGHLLKGGTYPLSNPSHGPAVYDLIGNAEEWTRTLSADDGKIRFDRLWDLATQPDLPQLHLYAVGGWYMGGGNQTAAEGVIFNASANERPPWRGFRCAAVPAAAPSD